MNEDQVDQMISDALNNGQTIAPESQETVEQNLQNDILKALVQNAISAGEVVTSAEINATNDNITKEISNLKTAILEFNLSLTEDQQDFKINDSDNKVSEFISLLQAKADRGVIDLKTASQPTVLQGELSIFKNDMFLQNRVDTLYNRAVDKGINASLKFAFTGLTASQIAQTSLFQSDPARALIELSVAVGTEALSHYFQARGADKKTADVLAAAGQGMTLDDETADLSDPQTLENEASAMAMYSFMNINPNGISSDDKYRLVDSLIMAMGKAVNREDHMIMISDEELTREGITDPKLVEGIRTFNDKKTDDIVQELYGTRDYYKKTIKDGIEAKKSLYEIRRDIFLSPKPQTNRDGEKNNDVRNYSNTNSVEFDEIIHNNFQKIPDPAKNFIPKVYDEIVGFYEVGDGGKIMERIMEKFSETPFSEMQESQADISSRVNEIINSQESTQEQPQQEPQTSQEPLQPEQPIVQEQPQQEEQIVQEPLQPEQPIVQEQPQQEEPIVQEQSQEEIQEATQEEITREENKPEQPKEQAQVQENRGNGFNPDIDTKIDSKEHSENAVGAKKSIIDRIKDGLQSVSERRALGEPLGVIVFKKLGDWGELLTNLPERIAKKKEKKQIESGFGSKKMALAEGVAKEETTVVEQEERKDTAQPVSEFDKRYQVSPEALASMAPQQEQGQQVQTQEQVQETDAIEQALGELGDEGIDPSVLEGLTEKPDEKGGDEPEL